MKNKISILIQLIVIFLPWRIRRILLVKLLHYAIHPNSHIGKSIILAKECILEEHSSIGFGTFCKSIDKLHLGAYSKIGNLCWITGVPNTPNSEHFKHISNRNCEIIIGKHTGITSRHYFDCTAGIYIGDYCQIAGFGTVLLSHSIDLKNSIQDAGPISIGNYCFIGLQSVILKDISICDKVVIGARSLVTRPINESHVIYVGNPAKRLKNIDDYKFFLRQTGELK